MKGRCIPERKERYAEWQRMGGGWKMIMAKA